MFVAITSKETRRCESEMPACPGRYSQEISMKNRLTVISRFSITAIALGSLSFGWSAAAQNPSPNQTSPAASLSAKDKTFMRKAAKGGMMEVAMGKLASEQGQSAEVKKFGERMVTDHSKANDELKSIAKKKGVKLPSKELSEKWKSDKDYMDAMVKDHEKDLAEFQEEAKEGTDSDLKEFAEKTAKVVQEHLDLAKETQSKLQ